MSNDCRVVNIIDKSDAYLFESPPYLATDILTSEDCNLIIKETDIRITIEFCYREGTEKFRGVAYILFDNDMDRDILIDWDQPVDEQELNNYVKILIESELSEQNLIESYINNIFF